MKALRFKILSTVAVKFEVASGVTSVFKDPKQDLQQMRSWAQRQGVALLNFYSIYNLMQNPSPMFSIH